MNAVDYLKEKERMCNALVCNCPMSKRNNGKGLLCESFEKDYPEQAVGIVSKWAKENPPKTYLSVLLERLPNMRIEHDGTPDFCPDDVFKIKLKPSICDSIACIDCWKKEYKEEK